MHGAFKVSRFWAVEMVVPSEGLSPIALLLVSLFVPEDVLVLIVPLCCSYSDVEPRRQAQGRSRDVIIVRF